VAEGAMGTYKKEDSPIIITTVLNQSTPAVYPDGRAFFVSRNGAILTKDHYHKNEGFIFTRLRTFFIQSVGLTELTNITSIRRRYQ